MATVDIVKLNQLADEEYLTGQKHPEYPEIRVWNYTAKTQFSRYWTPETKMCRGLITRDDGTVIARPFVKFFNIEEMSDTGVPTDEPFEVTLKMDGSLGILCWINDVPYIATRGSFTSAQAQHATKLYRERYQYKHIAHRGYTYLFEIIYPSNRIVVDYGDMDDLVLIGVINTENGSEVPLRMFHGQPFPITKVLHSVHDLKELAQLRDAGARNEEGYVVRFEKSNLRVKMKHADYVRLHRIMTNITERGIWEHLSEGRPLNELLDRVPDEFYDWVREVESRLLARYTEIEFSAREAADEVAGFPTRKEQAIRLRHRPNWNIAFAMLDGNDYSKSIWKLVRPPANKPFMVDADA